MNYVYFCGFRTFATWTFYVFYFLSFAQRLCVASHIVGVDKEIFAAIIWCNEAKAFLNVEKFNGSFGFVRFGHEKLPFLLFCLFS